MFWKRVTVSRGERAIVVRGGQFRSILTSGTHRVFCLPGVSFEVERHRLRDFVFHSKWSNYLVRKRPEVAALHFRIVKTNDVQVGIVYVDGRLFAVMPPNRRMLFWRGPAEVTVELVDVLAEPEIPSGVLEKLEGVTSAGDEIDREEEQFIR